MTDPATPDEQGEASRASRSPRWPLGLVAGLIFVVDQLTKAWVRSSVEVGEQISVVGDFLQIGHVHNRGIAFGLFSGAGGWVVFAALLAGVVLALTMSSLAQEDRLIAFGIACLAGGASGNIVDRLLQGYVTDMIQLPSWPSFNVADIGITVGVCLVVVANLRSMRTSRAN